MNLAFKITPIKCNNKCFIGYCHRALLSKVFSFVQRVMKLTTRLFSSPGSSSSPPSLSVPPSFPSASASAEDCRYSLQQLSSCRYNPTIPWLSRPGSMLAPVPEELSLHGSPLMMTFPAPLLPASSHVYFSFILRYVVCKAIITARKTPSISP